MASWEYLIWLTIGGALIAAPATLALTELVRRLSKLPYVPAAIVSAIIVTLGFATLYTVSSWYPGNPLTQAEIFAEGLLVYGVSAAVTALLACAASSFDTKKTKHEGAGQSAAPMRGAGPPHSGWLRRAQRYVWGRIGQWVCYAAAAFSLNQEPTVGIGFLVAALLLRHTFLTIRNT